MQQISTNFGDVMPGSSYDHRVALIDLRSGNESRTFSVKEMRDRITCIGHGLLHKGLRAGDRIALLSENRAEFFQSYFAVLKAGLVAVPVNFKLSREVIQHIFEDADVRLAIADDDRIDFVPAGYPIIHMDGIGPDSLSALSSSGSGAETPPSKHELAKILYTSGSTGTPKGVPLGHAGQLWALSQYKQQLTEGDDDRTLVVAPAYHKNGLFYSTVALANLTTLILLRRFEARAYLKAVATYRCTTLSGIPTMFALIAREEDLVSSLELGSVKRVMIGSAPLTQALVERVQAIFPNAEVFNGYGTTEAGPGVFGPHPLGLTRPSLSLGYPLADVECKLLGDGAPEEGVLALKTPALMKHYLNLPEATAERLKDGWYITGDVMRRDADGFFYFVGRADDMFVCGGENVYPGEVEKLLEKHPFVAQAVVVPVPDDIKGHIPVAFVVPKPNATPDEQMIRDFALAKGPAYSHPRIVLFKDELPLAGTQKVDRAQLLREALASPKARKRLQDRQIAG